MQQIDDRIDKEMKSETYQNASDKEKIEIVRKLLTELSDEGLIKKSFLVNDEMGSIEYANGALGGIKLTPFDPTLN